MYWLDIVVIVVLAVSTFLGLKAGIIKSVLSLAGVIVGVVLAGQYHDTLAGVLPFFSEGSGTARVVAFVIILIAVMVIAVVLARLLKFVASIVLLGWVNHLGGAVFGLVLGALFCGAVLAIWVKWFGAGSAIDESFVSTFLLDKFPMVLAFLPGEFDAVRSFFQ